MRVEGKGVDMQLTNALEPSVLSILHKVEIKDYCIASHQRRVAHLAVEIAREIGFTWRDTRDLYLAALLHDVGKLEIPSEILNKPGRLTQHEFSIIKKHPQFGYEMLEKIDLPRSVMQSVFQHHERINGTGYPKGLSGEDIPLQARILAVADVVDAITSARPYRPALGVTDAFEEITMQMNVLYDSDVVNACLRRFQNNELRFKKVIAAAPSADGYVQPAESMAPRIISSIYTASETKEGSNECAHSSWQQFHVILLEDAGNDKVKTVL